MEERQIEERQIIVDVLRSLGRRLWINRAIQEAAFISGVILFCLVCFQVIGPALIAAVPSIETVARLSLLAACAIGVLEAGWRSARPVSARQAAGVADATAHLKDELKSAHWFLADREISPFAQLQVQRAAVTATGLDLTALAPAKLPLDAFAVAGLGSLLAALIWMTPYLSRSWDSSYEAGSADYDGSADTRTLLNDGPQVADIQKLDLALRTLKQSDASPEEKRRALANARDAIDQANVEASDAREGLAELAQALKSDPKFESVAQALDQGRVDEAVALLRKIKADAAVASAPEEKVIEPADKGNAPENSISQALESAGRDLTGKNAAVNQDAINRVINTLAEANELIEVQNRVNRVRRRMENNLTVTSQRSQLTASQFDNRTNAPNPTPSPETGTANLRGGTLFRQAAVAREENDNAREGSQSGDASGDSPALPLEGAATSRLDAQLKLETILQHSAAGEDPNGKGDPGWFYSASREQKSMLRAEDVRPLAGYDREAAITHDRVPVRQKSLVKNYFLNLHESEEK